MTRKTLLGLAVALTAVTTKHAFIETGSSTWSANTAFGAQVAVMASDVGVVLNRKRKGYRPTQPHRPGPRSGESRQPSPFG